MIFSAYSDYTNCIAESLVKMKVDIRKLRAHSLSLCPGCDERNLMPLSFRAGDKFEQLDNVYDFISELRKFTSFLDCSLFEEIIRQFKIKNQEKLKYPEKLRQYIMKHTVSEFMEIDPKLTLNEYTDDTKELVIILDIEQITNFLKEVLDIGQVLAYVMNIDQRQLLIHKIGEGSVTVTFLIPTSVAEYMFSGRKECIFSQEQFEEFRKVSIVMLKCNDYEFDLTSPLGKFCRCIDE